VIQVGSTINSRYLVFNQVLVFSDPIKSSLFLRYLAESHLKPTDSGAKKSNCRPLLYVWEQLSVLERNQNWITKFFPFPALTQIGSWSYALGQHTPDRKRNIWRRSVLLHSTRASTERQQRCCSHLILENKVWERI
jgi:hypothetical protein